MFFQYKSEMVQRLTINAMTRERRCGTRPMRIHATARCTRVYEAAPSGELAAGQHSDRGVVARVAV